MTLSTPSQGCTPTLLPVVESPRRPEGSPRPAHSDSFQPFAAAAQLRAVGTIRSCAALGESDSVTQRPMPTRPLPATTNANA